MQYFKHMSNMRNDVKIKRLISRYGIEGYGLYCLIIESITERLTTESPVPELQETCDDLADFYGGNTSKINEMVSFMINQSLLEVDEISERVTCQKIYKFLEASQTRSERIKELIKNYKESDSYNLLLPEPVIDSHKQSDTVTTCTVEEQNRTRTEQEHNTYTDSEHSEPVNRKAKDFSVDSIEYQMALRLLQKIRVIDPGCLKGKEAISLKKWAVDMDGLMRIDRRGREEVEKVMDYAMGSWWKDKISTAKFFRNNFPKMAMQANLSGKQNPGQAPSGYFRTTDMDRQWAEDNKDQIEAMKNRPLVPQSAPVNDLDSELF